MGAGEFQVNAEAEKVQRGGVKSAEVALRLLRILAEEGGDLSLSRLAAAADMAPAKVHRYMVSLMRAGFLEQAARSASYTLGAQALRVGLVALARVDIVGLGTEAAATLRDRTEQTALLAIWGQHGPTIMRWMESISPVTVNVRVGSAMPILRSATGQVFGAWMPTDRIAPLVKAELAVPGSPVSSDRAARSLFADIREQGLSCVAGAMLPGIHALGAPVFDAKGELAAALTVLGTEGAFDPSREGRVAGELRRVAADLSHRLGFGTDIEIEKGKR